MPCAENATCLAPYTNSFFTENFSTYDMKSSFTCKCANKTNCFKPADPCSQEQNFCQNGGTCVSYWQGSVSMSTCLCPEGTTGSNCEKFTKCLEVASELGHEPCLFGGECVSSVDAYFNGADIKCNCKPGFKGEYCNQCSSNPCQNGGSCVLNSDTSVQCICQYGYKGMYFFRHRLLVI